MADGQKDKVSSRGESKVQSTPAARPGMDPEQKALIMDGWAAIVTGNAAEALAKFQAALSSPNSSVEANYGEAVALKTLGRSAEAIKAFEHTIARLNSIDTPIERVRVTMLKHLAESAMRDLQASEGK